MKMILKAVADKIKLHIMNSYNNYLNKIAVKSNIYKDLYNRLELNRDTVNRIEEFRAIMSNSVSPKLLGDIFRYYSVNSLQKFDRHIVNLSEISDLIIVASESEKEEFQKEMNRVSGSGKVLTFKEFIKRPELLSIHNVYISSSIWIKDMTQLVNLLYRINTNIERYK